MSLIDLSSFLQPPSFIVASSSPPPPLGPLAAAAAAANASSDEDSSAFNMDDMDTDGSHHGGSTENMKELGEEEVPMTDSPMQTSTQPQTTASSSGDHPSLWPASTSTASPQPPPQPRREPSEKYLKEKNSCLEYFQGWNEQDQIDFVEDLLSGMCHYQHGTVNAFLKPMLQRDFISLLPKKGLEHVAEKILGFLDANSLCAAELVCRPWLHVISEGMLWKKLIERKVHTDSLWRGLAERRGWIKYLFLPRPGEEHPAHDFYRRLYPSIIKDIDAIENNWRCGKHNLQRINCRSENSKGVYCLQYDDTKIVSGLRDNTIKMWDRANLSCLRVLNGHTGSVLCLQYDDKVIISGSSDSTVSANFSFYFST